MTNTTFFALKAGLRETMKDTLNCSKYRGEAIKDYCLEAIHHTVTSRHEDDSFEAKESLMNVQDYIERYPEAFLKVTTIEERQHCRTEAIGVRYEFKRYVFRATIEDWQVDEQMKEFVKKKLKLDRWDTLQCRVLDLFKQGVIGWDKVEEAHTGNCSL